MQPKIGLVTVLYKSDNVLEDFFLSLGTQSYTNYFLYCIDNSPSQNTKRLVSQLAIKFNLIDKILHIENNENTGVASGNNQGIELAFKNGCEYILLLNNDIEFKQSDLLEDLVNTALEKKESIVIPKIFFCRWYC